MVFAGFVLPRAPVILMGAGALDILGKSDVLSGILSNPGQKIPQLLAWLCPARPRSDTEAVANAVSCASLTISPRLGNLWDRSRPYWPYQVCSSDRLRSPDVQAARFYSSGAISGRDGRPQHDQS